MSGTEPSPPGATPPRNTQSAWSQPLENDQRPDSLKPPSTRSTLPVGAYDDDTCTELSAPHTSRCARSSNRPSCQLCTPSTPSTQPLEAHALATSMIAS